MWFAEDAAFGAQSYRVNCRYFTAEPVNEAVVAEAIRHCCSVSGYADTEFQEVEILEATEEMNQVTADTLADAMPTISGELPEGITYYGSSLLLESGTVVRHYFRVANDADVSAYGFTGNKDHYYYMDLSAVPGTATGACVIGGYTLSYDPMCYVRAVLTSQKSTDSLKLVAKALYLYRQAAEAYQQA